MNTEQIIAELEAERDRIDNIIRLLRGDPRTTRSGRRRRFRTAEQTRRISEGMKRHWIERRKKMKGLQPA